MEGRGGRQGYQWSKLELGIYLGGGLEGSGKCACLPQLCSLSCKMFHSKSAHSRSNFQFSTSEQQNSCTMQICSN